ncbi:MAG TPA: cysteine desulfurase family protein [Thermoanaerobaculia bacterium]|jgi:cysteine desulfurase|nr:cysteine desulfurase family protein [Thermoanaerobaculia bacterium]
MRIYLDNNATTAIDPDVMAVLATSLRDVFGNASSIHKEGQAARRVIEDARESVARLLCATGRELVFTSGGSESNNAAIFGAVTTEGRFHIVTSEIEHPSVAEAVRSLELRRCEVTRVAPSRSGVIDADAVIAAIRPDTKLVTVMMANNETGVVQPVAAIGRACRERGVHFHVDAVQAAGKIAVDVDAIACDTLAISAHKMHAPKGIGALYVRRGLSMNAHIVGGAQERRRRAGTENVPLAAAFGVAAALPSAVERVGALRDRFEAGLREVVINGRDVARIPNTSNVMFPGADGEGIVIALDLSGVAVSTGSACSSGRVEPSSVLLAMGLSPDDARSTVRFSLSRFTTEDEIDRVGELLHELVPRCRTTARQL